MSDQFPSLITGDPESGLALAGRLAGELHAQIETAGAEVQRPGGTNYCLPTPIPKEVIAAVLFYAIATSNQGWTAKT